MKRDVPSIRFCVPAEFLGCHLTKLRFQSLAVNEPAGSRQTRSNISLDLDTRVPHRWLGGCCFGNRLLDIERDEHRMNTADNTTTSFRRRPIGSWRQEQRTSLSASGRCVWEGMTGQMNGYARSKVAAAALGCRSRSGSFTRPDLVIPRRVARQQSPVPFRQARTVYASLGRSSSAFFKHCTDHRTTSQSAFQSDLVKRFDEPE